MDQNKVWSTFRMAISDINGHQIEDLLNNVPGKYPYYLILAPCLVRWTIEASYSFQVTHTYIYIYMLNLDSSIQAQYIYFLSLQLHLAMKRALKTIFADFKSLIITLILLQCITKQLNPLRQGCLDHRFKEPYFLFAGGNQRNIWLLFAEVLMMGMKVTFFKLLLQEGSEVMVSDLEPTEAALGWFW